MSGVVDGVDVAPGGIEVGCWGMSEEWSGVRAFQREGSMALVSKLGHYC